jgi:hypothetical protein
MKGFRKPFLSALALLCLSSFPALADCTNPAGVESQIVYNADYHTMQFCNGTDWINMAKGSLVTQCSNASTPPTGTGYFVLTSGAWDGNLGGLSGADAKCLSDLTANDWMYKSDAQSRGLLDAAHVKAWLVAYNSANNAVAGVTYTFAVSGDATKGGATFVTDSNGLGPGNAQDWSGTNYFDGYKEYWTGRDTGDTATLWGTGWTGAGTSLCYGGLDWDTNSSGVTGRQGISSATDKTRFNHSTPTCDQTRRLVCFVHP